MKRSDSGFKLVVVIVVAILIVLIILFLPPGAKATTSTITSLPYTANQTGTAYSETLVVQGTRLESATYGINFTGHDIVLNLGSDTIGYGAGLGDANHGFSFAAGIYNIKMIGGWLIHKYADYDELDNPLYDTLTNACHAVYFAGAFHDIYFDHMNIEIGGDNVNAFTNTAAANQYHLEVYGGQIESHSRRYTNRCNYNGAIVLLETAQSSYDSTLVNFYFHGLNVLNGPGQGIALRGRLGSSANAIVAQCTVLIDQRNDFYTYPSGNVCFGSGNAYDIVLRFCGAGSKVHDCICRSGGTYMGSEGILIENSDATDESPIAVYNNDVRVNEGYDAYGYCRVYGIKIRNIDNGHLYGVWVHDNYVEVSADTSGSTSGWSAAATGIVLGYDDAFQPGGAIKIERNHVKAYNHLGLGDTQIMALMLDIYPGSVDSSNFLVRNNYWESSQFIMSTGGANGGSTLFNSYGDTMAWGESITNDHCVFHDGGPANNCGGGGTNNAEAYDDGVTDAVYMSAGMDTNIVFYGFSTDQEFYLRKTLTVHVIGSNYLPVSGATVTIKNAYNQTVGNLTTSQFGIAKTPVTYWYESRAATDSTAFNPFSIKAKSGTDSVTVSNYYVRWDSGSVAIMLPNTAGTGAPGGVRASFIFMHRSVGGQAVLNPSGPTDLFEILDSSVVSYGADTARIVYRSNFLNNQSTDNCLTDTFTSGGNFVIIGAPDNTCYGWGLTDFEQMISDPDYGTIYSPQVGGIWTNDEASAPWSVFDTNYIGSTWEYYNMVMVKTPYTVWRDPTQARMDSLKLYYQRALDTVITHPELNYCFVFGTPLKWDDEGEPQGMDFDEDTSQAKLVWQTAQWFASDSFFVHDTSTYKNVWKLDTYSPLCDTSYGSQRRYCLNDSYTDWRGGHGGSHLNLAGATVMQTVLADFIREATFNLLGGLEGPPPPPTVTPLNYCMIDTCHSDAVGELDTVLAIWSTQASTGDSVWLAVSTSGYPDSSGATWQPFVDGVVDTLKMTVSLTEAGYVYMSAGVKEGELCSSRSQDNRYFNVPSPPSAGGKLIMWRKSP